MPQIIPAILTDNLETFRAQIKQMEGAADLAQIDIGDGIFVPQKTITIEDIKKVPTPLFYELHLMTAEPAEEIEKCSDFKNIKKIIFHLEATTNPLAIIEQIEENGYETGLAINPETSLENIVEYLYQIDFLTFLTVNPGQQGQKFIPAALEKIRDFKAHFPQIPVEVDGGIHEAEIKQLAGLGVEYLAVGSEIFAHPEPAARFKELQNLASENNKE